jgi:zinc transporter, ZIP family
VAHAGGTHKHSRRTLTEPLRALERSVAYGAGDIENRSHSSLTWLALPFAGLTVLSTLAGGLVALRLRRELQTLIALTGGIVVAVALFDVLPEAMEAVDDPNEVAALVGVGFLVFFLAERGLVLHHRDDPEQARAHGQVGAIGAAGLSLHSFIDGLGIGLAFGLDTATGVLVFLAVVSHDFADGLNTVGFILRQGGDRIQALRWLAADAIAPLLGAIVGASLHVSEARLGQLLALYVGFFLFMGATDLLPHAHEHPSRLRVALTVFGFALTFLISLAARG